MKDNFVDKEWDKLIKVSVVIEQDGHKWGREDWISPEINSSELLEITITDLGKSAVKSWKDKK